MILTRFVRSVNLSDYDQIITRSTYCEIFLLQALWVILNK